MLEVFRVLRRTGFRFLFVYAVLYYLPFPLTLYPDDSFVDRFYEKPCAAVVVWFAQHVFQVTHEIRTGVPTGSGDTMYQWLRVVVFAFLAVVAAAVWTVADRRRATNPRLVQLLSVYVRYAVGSVLVVYGIVKVVPMQFARPTLLRLVEPLGDFSPMGLLWNWMGASPAYGAFRGVAEVVAGTLLFFRRTTTLGALVGAAALANVVALNLTYDVPVKLYSMHLLASVILLGARDARRVFRALVLQRSTRAVRLHAHFVDPWKNRTLALAKAALIVWLFGRQIADAQAAKAEHDSKETSSPIYGIWEVDTYTRNGAELPPLLTDPKRLRRVIASGSGVVTFAMNDARVDYRQDDVCSTGSLTLTPHRDSRAKIVFLHRRIDLDHLELRTTVDGDDVVMSLHRTDPGRMTLNARGFHWVQEYPFNR